MTTTEDPIGERIKYLLERRHRLQEAIELKQAFRLEEARAELERVNAELSDLADEFESERYSKSVPISDALSDVMQHLSYRVARDED